MQVFPKIWDALFSWNTQIEIRPFALLSTNNKFGLRFELQSNLKTKQPIKSFSLLVFQKVVLK